MSQENWKRESEEREQESKQSREGERGKRKESPRNIRLSLFFLLLLFPLSGQPEQKIVGREREREGKSCGASLPILYLPHQNYI